MIVCPKGSGDKIVDLLQRDFYLNEKNRILLSDDLELYVQAVGQPGNGLSVLDPQN